MKQINSLSTRNQQFSFLSISSVSWQVQELIIEYASQIGIHLDRLIKCVEKKNWRISPNVLLGARVAVFRKTATLTPTVLTG
jgi:hypothetical protein